MSIKGTILIISQENQVLQAIDKALSSEGFNVVCAQRGIQGIDLARKTPPDLVITEMNLPDMHAPEIATAIRRDIRMGNIPIVAISPPGTNLNRDLALVAGINGFIPEPLNPSKLPLQLEYYLNGATEIVDDTTRWRFARDELLSTIVERLEERVRDLELKNAKLEEIDQFKDNFIKLMAHELRTPLTLLLGYGSLMVDYNPIKDLTRADNYAGSLVSGLEESLSRLQMVVEEILTISRIMTSQIELNIEVINLRNIINEILKQYKDAIAQRHLHIYFDATNCPEHMRADGRLLGKVISNLISNAIKYTPDGGRIIIQTASNYQYVKIRVKDTGIGIDLQMQKEVFENFHFTGDIDKHSTSKTAFEGGGLGLGLSICKGIIEAHRGNIEVKSAGRDREALPGSTFTITLPIHQPTGMLSNSQTLESEIEAFIQTQKQA
ncbi:hybrid sensor histidine kinase/response regulator [Anaerolineales bacterium]